MTSIERPSVDISRIDSLHCRDRELSCPTIHAGVPVVMGILNVTPDSFSDGGRYESVDAALRRAEDMVAEGARVIDVGGESTRPRGSAYGEGALAVDGSEERRRILPVISAIVDRFPEVIISVDTYKADVARDAIDAGAHIINDVTGLRYSRESAEIAAETGAALIVMHSLGRPGEMPHEHGYDDVRREVCGSLARSVEVARAAGVRSIAVDPGFGFGKSSSENLRILNDMSGLHKLQCPIMVGISRKATIGRLLASTEEPLAPEERLFGTLGATSVAVQQGASIVRTHDVRATLQFLTMMHETVAA